MARTMIIVSDDQEFITGARLFAQARGAELEVYTTQEWSAKNASTVSNEGLTAGTQPVVEGGAKILPFPGNHVSGTTVVTPVGHQKVQTINNLESEAIENAIHSFNGNLTEAAKALGIGRATLYRKVKQYNIDPASARKKRAA